MGAGPALPPKLSPPHGRLFGFGWTGPERLPRPEAHLVPFTQSPEWVVPGKTMSFATAQPRRRGAIPLLATTFDGRPIKMEGNPLHPVSQGNSDNHAQSSILDLYDPARRRHLTLKGKKATPEQLEAEIQRIRAEAANSGGATLGILADESVSPTRERLRADILRQFPQATWAVYEPFPRDTILRLRPPPSVPAPNSAPT